MLMVYSQKESDERKGRKSSLALSTSLVKIGQFILCFFYLSSPQHYFWETRRRNPASCKSTTEDGVCKEHDF